MLIDSNSDGIIQNNSSERFRFTPNLQVTCMKCKQKLTLSVEAGSLKCSHPGHEVLRQSSSVALKMSHKMAYNIQYSTGNNW